MRYVRDVLDGVIMMVMLIGVPLGGSIMYRVRISEEAKVESDISREV